MENTELYIKYKYLDNQNQPVPIDTSYGRGPQGALPLTTVAHLIAAYQARPGSLLANTDSGLITLHSINNEEETSYNSWDPLTILGQNGRTGICPLIIKSSQQEMEVDAIPTTSDSFGSSINIKIDGIALGTEHLMRNELVEKLQALVSLNSVVLLTSPAGSGKSSLFMLYKAATNAIVVGIPLMDKRTPFELLRAEGIDLMKKEISEKYKRRNVVVFLDDAQKKYSDVSFWESLVKTTGIWLPQNIKFIISATHSLSGGNESPVEFQSLPKLTRMDFLLTDDEAYQFLDFRDIGLPANIREHRILKDFLVKESGGLVGALRLSVNSLKGEFYSYKNGDIPETLCLQYCLSLPFVQNMARCFGSGHSYPAGDIFKLFLKKCFGNEKFQVNKFEDQQDEESYSSLKKAGILVEFPDSTFGFSSPLAKKYYFKWIFPNRSFTQPSSLPELIRNVIGNMSATILRNSTTPGDFPKEAVFQHLFMEGLALFTPINCSICTELSKSFPSTNSNTPQTIAGEIDFYLNSNLRWGIELLVNGNGIGEHISRFTPPNGKYVALAVSDYTVVDIRRNSTGQPSNISIHPNRITVFFKEGDYSIAHCIFGKDNTPVVISLSN